MAEAIRFLCRAVAVVAGFGAAGQAAHSRLPPGFASGNLAQTQMVRPQRE